jgi:hypothetical protein
VDVLEPDSVDIALVKRVAELLLEFSRHHSRADYEIELSRWRTEERIKERDLYAAQVAARLWAREDAEAEALRGQRGEA